MSRFPVGVPSLDQVFSFLNPQLGNRNSWSAAPYLVFYKWRVGGGLGPAELNIPQCIPLLDNFPTFVEQKVHHLVDHAIRLWQGIHLLTQVYEDIIIFIILRPVLLCWGRHLQQPLSHKAGEPLLDLTSSGD